MQQTGQAQQGSINQSMPSTVKITDKDVYGYALNRKVCIWSI